MKILIYVFVLIGCNSLSYAQLYQSKRKPSQQIELAICPQYFLNNAGIDNDNAMPELISAGNNFGGFIETGYKRITRYNMTLGAGLLLGSQTHDVTVHYQNLDFFYPPYSIGVVPDNNRSHYKATIPYVGAKVSIGYQGALLAGMWEDVSWEASLGLQARLPISRYYKDNYHPIDFRADSQFFLTDFGGEVAIFGSKPFRTVNLLPEFYVGVKKNILKRGSVSLGALITRGITAGYSGFATVEAYTRDHTFNVISTDKYKSKDFSIGFRLGVGFW